MAVAPHQFWQEIEPPGTHPADPALGHRGFFPAALPDGRQIQLPIRVLPGDGRAAVASLILNQASFAVLDAIADAVADLARPVRPEIVVAVPTLGLPLAEGVARRLGHPRMVALGTSRKFWYDEALSVPLRSITSPYQEKRLYLDPRMLPLLAGRRFIVVDDVVSTGASVASVLALLASADLRPAAVLAAMLQGDAGSLLPAADRALLAGAFATPRLMLGNDGGWRAAG